MKRFIFSILFVSVFCIGLGALVEKTGAKFKSDEKALAIIRDARQAIGGDSAIAGVKSISIVGQSTHTMKVNGLERTEQGETEIALQLPDKLMKIIKIGHGDGNTGSEKVMKQVNVEVGGSDKEGGKVIFKGEGTGEGEGAGSGHRVNKIVIKKADGTTEELSGAEAEKVIVRHGDSDKAVFTTEDGKTVVTDGNHVMMKRIGGPEGGEAHASMRHNELLRLTLGLLLTSPEGMDVNYTFGGESDVDGMACNIVVADFAGSSFKLFIDKTSNLPVMMSYTGEKMPHIMTFHKEGANAGADTKGNVVFTRKIEGPRAEKAEFQVKFSDYRYVGGVQLPYKWTQTVGGAADSVFDVTNYEINPANIADKFNNQNVKVRIRKPDSQ